MTKATYGLSLDKEKQGEEDRKIIERRIFEWVTSVKDWE